MTFDEHFAETIEAMKMYIIDEPNLSGISLAFEDGFTFRLSIPKQKLEKIRLEAPMKKIAKARGFEIEKN